MVWASKVGRIALLVAFSLAISGATLASDTKEREEELGKKYAAEVKKDYKLVTDPDVVARVERIGGALAAVANKVEVPAIYGSSEICQFNYEFYVVEDDDPNAFSLPGGQIFINSGLLKMAAADEELAGVIAHEIAHAAHHHVAQIIRQQSRIDKYVALVALVGVMTKVNNRDLNNVLMGASMLRQGQISGYTLQAEKDADKTAVAYMAKSPYNPMGLVDFMRKLERMHDENPTAPLGIYQTHPSPFRRVAAMRKAMVDAGVKVDMRKLRGVACALAVESTPGSGEYKVQVCGKDLCAPATLDGVSSSKSRADAIAGAVNDALDQGVRPEEVRVVESKACLMARGKVLYEVNQKDLASENEDVKTALEKARAAVARAAWADWLVTTCDAREEMNP